MHTPGETEVETYSGQYVDVRRPNPDTIDIVDIAHALSNTCRYGGHCRTFYSVAEHAVFVSKRLERQGHSVRLQLAGLHHDDAEAYLNDIPRPLKPLLGDPYAKLTKLMDVAIGSKLGIAWSDFSTEPAVKEADRWSLFVEARDLLPSRGKSWHAGQSWAQGYVPSRIVTPDYYLGGLSPASARALYLDRHDELTGGET